MSTIFQVEVGDIPPDQIAKFITESMENYKAKVERVASKEAVKLNEEDVLSILQNQSKKIYDIISNLKAKSEGFSKIDLKTEINRLVDITNNYFVTEDDEFVGSIADRITKQAEAAKRNNQL